MKDHLYLGPLALFGLFSILTSALIYTIYPNVLVAAAIGLNIGSFGLFAYDKGRAAHNKTRVPEIILLAAALLAGSIGALCAVTLLRHKSRKASFQFKLAVIIIFQIIAFIYANQRYGFLGIV